MIKISEYENYISRPTPLSDLEMAQVKDYEKMVLQSKIYEDDITSVSVNEVREHYDNTMMKATLMAPENKNPNIAAALQRNTEMNNELDKIKQLKNNEELSLTLKQDNSMGLSAGFTNASIIIFAVLLVGIIASVLLLSLS